jgi:hypothetical protein
MWVWRAHGGLGKPAVLLTVSLSWPRTGAGSGPERPFLGLKGPKTGQLEETRRVKAVTIPVSKLEEKQIELGLGTGRLSWVTER